MLPDPHAPPPPPPLLCTRHTWRQVPIFNLLRKFDGETVSDDIKAGRRRFRVTRLPRYLCLHMRRFTKNNFFIEKNPTIVNFPVKNLELRDCIPLPPGEWRGGGGKGGGVVGGRERRGRMKGIRAVGGSWKTVLMPFD